MSIPPLSSASITAMHICPRCYEAPVFHGDWQMVCSTCEQEWESSRQLACDKLRAYNDRIRAEHQRRRNQAIVEEIMAWSFALAFFAVLGYTLYQWVN